MVETVLLLEEQPLGGAILVIDDVHSRNAQTLPQEETYASVLVVVDVDPFRGEAKLSVQLDVRFTAIVLYQNGLHSPGHLQVETYHPSTKDE